MGIIDSRPRLCATDVGRFESYDPGGHIAHMCACLMRSMLMCIYGLAAVFAGCDVFVWRGGRCLRSWEVAACFAQGDLPVGPFLHRFLRLVSLGCQSSHSFVVSNTPSIITHLPILTYRQLQIHTYITFILI